VQIVASERRRIQHSLEFAQALLHRRTNQPQWCHRPHCAASHGARHEQTTALQLQLTCEMGGSRRQHDELPARTPDLVRTLSRRDPAEHFAMGRRTLIGGILGTCAKEKFAIVPKIVLRKLVLHLAVLMEVHPAERIAETTVPVFFSAEGLTVFPGRAARSALLVAL
jgi:hypothetical protein